MTSQAGKAITRRTKWTIDVPATVLFAIAVVLIVPLVLSLRSLEHLYDTSRLLRDREFAASLLLGSFRERTDDARRAEDAHAHPGLVTKLGEEG